jgi:hypothetical protein
MKPLVGVIHELPLLPKVLEIAYLINHKQIQQRLNYFLAPVTIKVTR